ncbi:flagellar basal-body rod protein FlgG [Spirochaetota bacterium]|nr:flagellar basal-body rod protein FlgG [Spirochaetota bacterium]
MVRGIYTGASGMAARVHQMNVVSNNLANVNTTGFKRDLTLFKAAPEMIARRTNDDGVVYLPSLGSIDTRPVVGRLGTGVEVNEVYNEMEQSSIRKTDNVYDFALEGKGFFSILTPNGERYTRNGSFTLTDDRVLVTTEGLPVLGEEGIIRLKTNNFTVNRRGEIYINPNFELPPDRPVRLEENGYEESELLDRIKVVRFERPRYLLKEGTSLYTTTLESGAAVLARNLFRFDYDGAQIKDDPDLEVRVVQGFLENSNVNPVSEMVKMIEVQRAYEASQKSIMTSDQLLARLINSMGSVTA